MGAAPNSGVAGDQFCLGRALLLLGITASALLLTFLYSDNLPQLLSPRRPTKTLNTQTLATLERWTWTDRTVHLVGTNTSAFALLASPEFHSIQAPIVVVVTDGSAPTRRSPQVDFLTVLGSAAPLQTTAFNAAATQLEATLGRNLFPFAIQAVDFSAHLSPSQMQGAGRPWVIWDASVGLVLIDSSLLESSFSQGHVSHMAALLVEKLFGTLATLLGSMAQAASSASLVQLIAQAAVVAIPAAFAAAPPLWFCILCPAVLGLLAPLAINFGLGEVAAIICGRMQLTDEQCFDLMMGAIGLGFVLSLASAIPIFFVCRLMECAHRNTTLLRMFSG